MKKLIVAAMALSTMFFVGCGGDDDDNGNGDTTITVTADTTAAPASPLVYNDAVWTSVASTSIPISTSGSLPVSPGKSPLGPSKALAAPSSVDLQAIKKDGRMYLRFQWNDYSLSMQRDNWAISDLDNYNFALDTSYGEDQLWISFEGLPSGGWDTWNWRVLTTGQVNRAEDGTVIDGDTTWDEGTNPSAYPNSDNDPYRPVKIHGDEWQFTGDVLLQSETVAVMEGYAGRNNWTKGQTVPGWYINDLNDWDSDNSSRWDVQAVYNYDPGIGGPGRYTVVLARDLSGGAEDLDMSETGRVKARIGIFDDYDYLESVGGDTKRKFSGDFWLALP
ncbi:MAG: hypothetical protein KAW46_06035 [candidate division Zixibacteria bacterium]|nr:hypothetical protein [candidate division Zixibacteria bacterium]